jgi:hypothetical protein
MSKARILKFGLAGAAALLMLVLQNQTDQDLSQLS